MHQGKILIVRHGKGRGRLRNYMRETLDHLRCHRHDVHQRLVFHATGEPPPSWHGVRVVVFWLGDPLREWYPACYEEAIRLANEARSRGLRLINAPEALSNCIKSVQARLWTKAEIKTPPVERFENFLNLKSAADRLVFPLLVRGDEHHAQHGARVFNNPDEFLRANPAEMPFPCAVSPLVDVRAGYHRAADNPECVRLFHKKRLIVANGTIRTKHTFFSSDPIVSEKSCIFGQHKWWPEWAFSPFLSRLELQCVEHDLVYWRKAEEHREVMLRACDVLGLQFAAIDYSNLSDGSPILWEANPYFLLPSLHQMMLPTRRLAGKRVKSYHDAIGDFLNGLLVECDHVGNGREAPMLHSG